MCQPASLHCSSEVAVVETKSRKGKQKERIAAGLIKINHQLWVHELVHTTELREYWPVSTDPNRTVAYLVDLTGSKNIYLDRKGQQMSMSTIIRDAVCKLLFPALFLDTQIFLVPSDD